MKKIIYFIPSIIFCILYGIALFVFDLEPIAYIFCILLIAAGILLAKNKWWGSIFGIIMGLWLMTLDFQAAGQIIRQWPLGLIIVIYFIICGAVIYRKTVHKIR